MPAFLKRFVLSFHSPRHRFLSPLSTTASSATAAAAAAAQSLHLDERSLSGSHSLVALLHSHGFSHPQIASLISRRPSLLRSHPDRVLRPKLQFLASAAGADNIPDLVTSNPNVLSRSLNNHLKPVLDLLLSFSSSPDDLLLAVRRNRWLLTCNLRRTLLPNITLLIGRGVPNGHISKLLTTHPSVLMQYHDHFAEAVGTAERLGVRPKLSLFIHAVRAMTAMRRSTRDARLEMLRGWGWSEEEIGAAFRRAPLFLLVSDEKMKRSVDFLVNTVGLGQADLSLQPKLLMYSLEKRIMPRFAVFKALESKGLVRKGSEERKTVLWLFICSEKIFLDRYVMRYSKEVSELMNVYCSKIEV